MSAHEHEFRVNVMCRVLRLSRSGYYAWRRRVPSSRAQANETLREQICEVFRVSRQTYGSPRLQQALQAQGLVCSRKRVARLMRLDGLVAKKTRRRKPQTTQRDPQATPAPNRLHQDFSAPAPDRKWAGDITYIDTAEGWLYLAVILDLYSRRVVGWAMDEHMQASLVQQAWQMAVSQRDPSAELLHHSDQGSQYTSALYQQSLTAFQCQVSMSRVGNCYDNAVAESFFATLKAECADHPFATRAQARTAIFEYIEAWYNRQRLHSTLGYLSPVAFERKPRH